jgi:hypothetical protein
MSFGYYARRVRDPERGTWRRFSALRACVASFCWLTGVRYRTTLEALKLDPESVRGAIPTDAFLLETLAALEMERARYLERLHDFESTRIDRKAKGNRQLSSAERAALLRLREEIRLPHPVSADDELR